MDIWIVYDSLIFYLDNKLNNELDDNIKTITNELLSFFISQIMLLTFLLLSLHFNY